MEDFAQYGTPLQSLDEGNIHLSKAPKLSDQIVTDKQGKRRFHGAFTGGFSAGYFNSVGTKKGWTPSSFVSSRAKRAEKTSNDPTYFMDEEDLDDFGIASQRIQATSDFEDPFNRGAKRRRLEDDVGPIPGQPVLKDLLKPVNITVGMKFLMKLGWRPGQGIGPRLSKREKKKVRREQKPLSHVDVESSSEESDEAAEESLSFAPDDVDNFLLLKGKWNLFGLGYKPLERKNILGENEDRFSDPFRMVDKKKKLSIRGHGFGVGAFEDEDEDIYSKEDMSRYDFGLGSPERSEMKREKSRWDCPIVQLREVLEGFHLSSKPLEKPKMIPLPSLPVNYQPWHESYRKFSQRNLVNKDRLTADDRKKIISNIPVVEIRAEVKIKKENNNEKGSGTENVSTEISQRGEPISSSGYRPFASNPEKQKRYEAYINSKGKDKTSIFPSYMTEWEKEREKGEFQRAEAFNRPLSSGMASRFTSAVHGEGGNQLTEGLNNMKDYIHHKGGERVPSIPVVMAEDMTAAKQKLFGRLTQCQVDWHPDKLLCKRFNVPNPFSSSTATGVQSSKKESFSIFSFLPTTPTALFKSVPPMCEIEPPKIVEVMNAEIEECVEEDYGLKVPVSGPPTIDLFNAIFQDSSDSEQDDDGTGHEGTVSVEPTEVNSIENMLKYHRNKPSVLLKEEENNSYSLNKKDFNLDDTRLKSDSSSDKVAKEFEYKGIEAKGIFKGINFSALNQYRSLREDEEEEDKGNSHTTGVSKDDGTVRQRHETSSASTDDDGTLKQKHETSSASTDDDGTVRQRHGTSSANTDDDGTVRQRHGTSSANTDDNSESDSDEEEYGPFLPPHMAGRTFSISQSSKIPMALKSVLDHVSPSLKEVEKKLKKAKKQKKKHKHKHKKHKKDSKYRN